MGRGLGPAQRAVLAALEDSDHLGLTVPELAKATGLSDRRVRAIVTALDKRMLVVVRRGCTGWRGAGEYGHAVAAEHDTRAEGLPRVTVREGEPWPGQPGYFAARDVEVAYLGMPAYGLYVMLTGRWYVQEREFRELLAAIQAGNG